ncbi:MAG: Crp/Fnr family transcriptional regulator [Planctomycetales bacterium]
MSTPPVQYLTDLPLFASLSEAEARRVAAACCRRSIASELIVQSEGQPAGWLGIVLCGQARISLFHSDGRELVLHLLFAGDCFGDTTVYGPRESPFNVICGGGTELLLVSLDKLREIAGKNPAFIRDLYEAALARQRALQTRLRQLAFERGEGRIVAYLQSLSLARRKQGSGAEGLPVPLTHQTIADNCGLTRETVSRALSRLQERGEVVRTRQGWLVKSPPSTDGCP